MKKLYVSTKIKTDDTYKINKLGDNIIIVTRNNGFETIYDQEGNIIVEGAIDSVIVKDTLIVGTDCELIAFNKDLKEVARKETSELYSVNASSEKILVETYSDVTIYDESLTEIAQKEGELFGYNEEVIVIDNKKLYITDYNFAVSMEIDTAEVYLADNFIEVLYKDNAVKIFDNKLQLVAEGYKNNRNKDGYYVLLKEGKYVLVNRETLEVIYTNIDGNIEIANIAKDKIICKFGYGLIAVGFNGEILYKLVGEQFIETANGILSFKGDVIYFYDKQGNYKHAEHLKYVGYRHNLYVFGAEKIKHYYTEDLKLAYIETEDGVEDVLNAVIYENGGRKKYTIIEGRVVNNEYPENREYLTESIYRIYYSDKGYAICKNNKPIELKYYKDIVIESTLIKAYRQDKMDVYTLDGELIDSEVRYIDVVEDIYVIIK